MSYSDKLRDPRWQRKRLEIFQRDNFTCKWCNQNDKTLNVHHRLYEKGKDPWDYPNEYLVTLCDSCHQYESESAFEFQKEAIEYLLKAGLFSIDISHVCFKMATALKVVDLYDLNCLLDLIKERREFDVSTLPSFKRDKKVTGSFAYSEVEKESR